MQCALPCHFSDIIDKIIFVSCLLPFCFFVLKGSTTIVCVPCIDQFNQFNSTQHYSQGETRLQGLQDYTVRLWAAPCWSSFCRAPTPPVDKFKKKTVNTCYWASISRILPYMHHHLERAVNRENIWHAMPILQAPLSPSEFCSIVMCYCIATNIGEI